MERDYLNEAFESYVSEYDLTDAKILLKYVHTGKVAQNCEAIARSLHLPQEDVELAWQIGMLHDIGRFEQLRRFDTFQDSVSINHAEFGADLLFGAKGQSERLIERFVKEDREYPLMELAIRCHNRYRIPENLTPRETMFCCIIRDADKVDIWRANYETGMEAIYDVSSEELRGSEITDAVYEAFLEGHTVLRSLKQHPLDHLVGHLALFFELVYPKSRELAVKQGYLVQLSGFESERSDTQEKLEKIRAKLQESMEECLS